MTIRQQSICMGYNPVGRLTRCEDYVVRKGKAEIHYKEYVDQAGVTIQTNWKNEITTIFGEDWCI